MKNKQFLPVILFVCGAVVAVAGMLMLCLHSITFKITGGVLVFIGVCLAVAGYVLTRTMIPKFDDGNQAEKYRPYSPAQTGKVVSAQDGGITAISQDDSVNVNVWGEMRELKVSAQRILYSAENNGAGTPFNGQELALLNEVLGNDLINGEEVKAAVLKYVNEVTAEWDDDYYEGKITSILPPEVEITEIIIDNVNEAQPQVLFCGEALCDEEHGIVIAFEDGQFTSIGSYGDFL